MKISRAMFFRFKPTKYEFLYKFYVVWLWWEIEFQRRVTL